MTATAKVKIAAPAVTIKNTGKHFEAPSEPVTVVAATPDAGHTIPAPKKATKKALAIVIPAGVSLITERAGRFAFLTAHDAENMPINPAQLDADIAKAAPAGWSVIEADTPDASIGADAAVTYLRGIGADASRALLMKLFPKVPKVAKPRTASVRVSRATITDEDLLKFIRGNSLTDARIQKILDTVRASGFSASQDRVDRLLGRVVTA
jgi:hypothetical protein